MKVIKSKRNKNTYTLEIEESYDVLNSQMDVSFKKLVKKAKVPGFRPGKVTRNTYEKHYGKEPIIQEAMMSVVNSAYMQAISEMNLEVVDYPKNVDIREYQENQPVHFKCEVDVQPEVNLGKYKGLKAKKESEAVEEEKVNEQVTRILENRAQFDLSEEGAKSGDIVRYHLDAKIDSVPVADLCKQNTGIQIGQGQLGQQFDDALIGLMAKDTKAFSITFESSFQIPEIAEKTVDFHVEILEVRAKKLPELTDELIKEATGLSSESELRQKIREDLEANAKHQSESKLKEDLISQVIENSKMDLHAIMIEREIESSIRYFDSNLRQSGSSVDKYLELTRKSADDLKNDFRETAEKRVRIQLVLGEISKKESIQISDEDINEEIKTWKMPNITSIEDARKNPRFNIESIREMIKERKTYDFIISQGKISS